jgi:hypothetical protein|eukprot:SAG25_NODE_163_length_13199_cov_5.774122_13_plen_129_part_00
MYLPSTSSHPLAGAVDTFVTRLPCTLKFALPWNKSIACACTCVGAAKPRLDQSTRMSHETLLLAQLATLTRVWTPCSTYAVARTSPVRSGVVVQAATVASSAPWGATIRTGRGSCFAHHPTIDVFVKR